MKNHELTETAVLAAIALGFAAAMFGLSSAAEPERAEAQTTPVTVPE